MNLIPWNIVRKDFRLTRPYLLAWWGILILGAVMTDWNLHRIMQDPGLFQYNAQHAFILDSKYQQELPYLSDWLVLGLDAVLLVVIVDLAIKADSPIDERAEWRTRPVSGLGVLRAKLLYLGLFCYLVPGAIQFLQFICLGSDWAECSRGLAHFVVLQSFWVSIVASAAVLFKRTFSGLLVFTSVAAVIFILDQTEYFTAITLDNVGSPFREGLPIAWVVLAILCLTGLGVSALLYLSHQRKPGFVTLGGGTLTAILVYLIWMKYPYPPPVAPQFDNQVQMTFDDHSVIGMASVYDHPNLVGLIFRPKITFHGAADTAFHVTGINSHMKWPGTNLAPIEGFQPADTFFNLAGVESSTGHGRLLEPIYPSDAHARLIFSKERLAQITGLPADFQATLYGEIGHFVADWDVPFAEHTIWAKNRSIFMFERRDVGFRGSLDLTLWEAAPANLPWMVAPPVEDKLRITLLYNPVEKEAIPGYLGFEDSGPESFSIYSINAYYASFDLVEILGNKYPNQAGLNALPTIYQDKAAWEAAIKIWQRDRDLFIQQHSQAMTDWLAGARLMELHFVPNHPVYTNATADSLRIITPDSVKNIGRIFP